MKICFASQGKFAVRKSYLKDIETIIFRTLSKTSVMDMTDVRHYDDSNEISIKISALEETFESSPNNIQNTSDKIENMVHPFGIEHINLINKTEKTTNQYSSFDTAFTFTSDASKGPPVTPIVNNWLDQSHPPILQAQNELPATSFQDHNYIHTLPIVTQASRQSPP